MKRELTEVIKYCNSNNINYHISVNKTGDGWVSPLGYTIYIYFDVVDETINNILNKFKRGIYKNSFILKSIGGNKYNLTAPDITKLKTRVELELEKYKRWIQSAAK